MLASANTERKTQTLDESASSNTSEEQFGIRLTYTNDRGGNILNLNLLTKRSMGYAYSHASRYIWRIGIRQRVELQSPIDEP